MKKIDYDIRKDDTSQGLMHMLSSADLALLTSELQTLGYRGWLRRYFEQSSEIESWLCKTPHQQDKAIAQMSAPERVLLLFGAIWHAQLAHATRLLFQDGSIQQDQDSTVRRSARGAICATAVYALMTKQVGWPFDMDCPFPGWD